MKTLTLLLLLFLACCPAKDTTRDQKRVRRDSAIYHSLLNGRISAEDAKMLLEMNRVEHLLDKGEIKW